MPRRKDFLDEVIEETAKDHREFPAMVDAALDSRRLLKRLGRERESLGLTQADVAARMATSQPAVARIEAGGTDAKLSTVDRFASAIGAKIEWRIVRRRRHRSKASV